MAASTKTLLVLLVLAGCSGSDVAGVGGAAGSAVGGAGGRAPGGAAGGSTASGGVGGTALGGAAGTAAGGVAGMLRAGAGGDTPVGGAGGRSVGGGGAGGTQGNGAGGASDHGCAMTAWPSADPAAPGTFATVEDDEVGPRAGNAENGVVPRFTVFRPRDLTQGGLCHPVITWGNGFGSATDVYMTLLNQLASHGFVVIASNSTNVSQGTPNPMVTGMTWLAAQNTDPDSLYYQRLDLRHTGSSGHSIGGMTATNIGSDTRVATSAALCGASIKQPLVGPALLLCGGMDTTFPCSNMMGAFNAINNQPVMMANQLAATHGSRIGSIKNPFMVAVTAWMRLQLMGDTSQRVMFYGPQCTLCRQTSVWQITRKMMDQNVPQ